MSISREELHRIIDRLPDDKLPKFADLLSIVYDEDDEELTELEMKDIQLAREQYKKGEYVTLEELLNEFSGEDNV